MNTTTTSMDPRKRLLTRQEAAAYIGVAPQTLAGWSATERVHLPYVRVGSLIKYWQSDLDDFLAANTVGRKPQVLRLPASNTICPSKQASETKPITHLMDPLGASKLLAANLGGNLEEWLNFLREDRHPRIEDGLREIPFDLQDGEFLYDERELYLFIISKNPDALNKADGVIDISNFKPKFYCDAHGDIDFGNCGQLMVYVSMPEKIEGSPWLTSAEARETARSLISIADWCDQHRYDAVTGKIITAETESLAGTGVSHE